MGWETERTNAQEGDVSQMKLRLGWAGLDGTAEQHAALQSTDTAEHSRLQGTSTKWGVRQPLKNPQSF